MSLSAPRQTAQRISEELTANAARSGERYVAVARAGFCALLLARNLTVYGSEIASGRGKEIVGLSILCMGLFYSVLVLWRGPLTWLGSLKLRLAASVFLDVLLVHIPLSAIISDPEPGYLGLLRSPYIMLYPMVVVAFGLRIYPRVILLGGVCATVSVGLILYQDQKLWSEQIAYGVQSQVFLAVVLLTQGVVAGLLAIRLRRMVGKGVETALDLAHMRRKMGAYLSEEIAAEALSEEQLSLGGARKQGAILFSDLRGFTEYAESLEPSDLVAELNDYFDVMVEAIQAQGGVVDKYVGDAIMAVFGAPQGREDDAVRALRAADAMRLALKSHNRKRQAAGLVPLRQGIGVHYGSFVAGNIGTQNRAQYTVMGDTVNLASRLESATKALGVEVIASEEVVEAAQAAGEKLPELNEMGEISVRGRAQQVKIYQVGSAELVVQEKSAETI